MYRLNTKFRLSLLLLLVGLPATSANATGDRSMPKWSSNVDEAMAEARRLQRPLLMHFYADWCGPCHRMEREVLNSPRLLVQLDRGFVAVKVNSDQHPELVERFDIRTLPSDVVIDPSGRVIAQNDGFQTLQAYQARLASAHREFSEAMRVHIARNGSGSTEPPPDPLDARDRRDAGPGGPKLEQPLPLRDGIDRSAVDVGLDGYSPISLWNNRKWRKGRPQFASNHRGIVYLMASDEERDQFRANPQRYAPQFLGCDPVLLAESGRAVRGNPQYGAYFSGMLYLFATGETRVKFTQSPHRYTQSRHTFRIDQIERNLPRLSERETDGRSK